MRSFSSSHHRRLLRRNLGLLLVALVLPLLPLSCQKPDRSNEPALSGAAAGWNLVIISVDTLRADRLGAYGYGARATSPAIDELIAGGVRFANAHAPRALTWPSLASLLTGLYPSAHGLISNGHQFEDGQSTLPLLLERRGYQTGAFLSNMCKANHQGWSAFFCAGGVDKRVNRRALEWLDQLESEQPFFLWTHFFGPHPPYYNGGELAKKELDPTYEGFLRPKKFALDRVMKESMKLAREDLHHLDALYDAAIMGTDRYVSELLAGLEERVDLQRTIVVFLADHGEDLYQHNGYLYHACSVYESSLHVPLAIIAPGLAPREVQVQQNVELVDVLPTLLDLLGLKADGCLDGASLVPYLERPSRGGTGKPAYSEYGDTQIHTVVQGRTKLVSNPQHLTPVCFPGGPADLYPIAPMELYQLEQDPGELDNLANQRPDEVERLLELLKQRQRGQCTDNSGREQTIPDELRKELEAMGYVAR